MLNLMERTFGMELEFGDVIKKNVELPEGYQWSPDERAIVNTDGSKSTPSGRLGGEINTRPLLVNRKDIRELRRVIRSCVQNNGIRMWNTGFNFHVYIGDLELEHLKKLFNLGYYVADYIYEYFHLADWHRVPHMMPIPTVDFYDRVNKCETLESFRNEFANSTKKGHYRYPVNVMHYYGIGTVEFRCPRTTTNFREVLEYIKFGYNFVDFALTKTEEDFKKIKSLDDFKKAFNLTFEVPGTVKPLIFASSVKNAVTNIDKGFKLSNKEKQVIINATGSKVHTVNPYMFNLELSLYDKKELVIHNNSKFNNLLYSIAKGSTITYKEDFEFLNTYKDGTAETEIALLMFFKKVYKYAGKDVDYKIKEFMAYMSKIDESIERLKEFGAALTKMFDNSTFVNNISIMNNNDEIEGDVVFQQYSDDTGIFSNLKKYADVSNLNEFQYSKFDYKNVRNNMIIISKNGYLDYKKIYSTNGENEIFIYGNDAKKVEGGRFEYKRYDDGYIVPGDDYKITEDTKLKLVEIKQNKFNHMRYRYIKKVDASKRARPILGVAVLDQDNIVLGAFGFEFPKDETYDMLLSCDFTTNNNVEKLSKLILFCVRTELVQSMLERKIVQKFHTGYTKVFTKHSVSMKYRGAFKKVEKTENSLVYSFKFGSIKNLDDCVKEYLKRLKASKGE